MSKKKINKFLYGFMIQVDYGGGWEDEMFEETYKKLKVQLKLYHENCKWPVRYIGRRELNPEWVFLQNSEQ